MHDSNTYGGGNFRLLTRIPPPSRVRTHILTQLIVLFLFLFLPTSAQLRHSLISGDDRECACVNRHPYRVRISIRPPACDVAIETSRLSEDLRSRSRARGEKKTKIITRPENVVADSIQKNCVLISY